MARAKPKRLHYPQGDAGRRTADASKWLNLRATPRSKAINATPAASATRSLRRTILSAHAPYISSETYADLQISSFLPDAVDVLKEIMGGGGAAGKQAKLLATALEAQPREGKKRRRRGKVWAAR
ncbi:hypothetical protein L227DRAFT_247163 [Lentinus tigrinus ALCF2SS1-6]|uniref:Uncharacterized protein n=1 Tax=Lentinus tigrinus ALCF2SS1-6 TaxID=1328759 RepID=A0A5C2S263_9APHY|nr:hypothetical protein L227DRAFT_247163 [Lentinus tigrinus ALCF2SS1-6]